MEKGETATQFMSKLADCFDRWTKLANIQESYAGLCEFIIVQQFLFACPKEVATHVREKALTKTDEVTLTADLYMDAHKISLWSDTKPK